MRWCSFWCWKTASHDAMTAFWVIQVLCCSWLSASMLVVMGCWTLADASSRYGEQVMKSWDHSVVRFASTFVQIACWHAGEATGLALVLLCSWGDSFSLYLFFGIGSALAVDYWFTTGSGCWCLSRWISCSTTSGVSIALWLQNSSDSSTSISGSWFISNTHLRLRSDVSLRS